MCSAFDLLDGKSYIAFINIASQIDLKPLAPRLKAAALSTIKSNTSLSKVSFMPSISNNLTNCLTKAFFGSVKILLNVSVLSGSK